MTQDDYADFRAALRLLSEFFPHPHSKPNLDAVTPGYFQALSILSLDQVQQVLRASLLTATYFPTIAELRTLGRVAQLEEAQAYAQSQHTVDLPRLTARPVAPEEGLQAVRDLLRTVWRFAPETPEEVS